MLYIEDRVSKNSQRKIQCKLTVSELFIKGDIPLSGGIGIVFWEAELGTCGPKSASTQFFRPASKPLYSDFKHASA